MYVQNNIDEQRNVIKNVALISSGIDKSGEYISESFIQDVYTNISTHKKNGVKSRINHPSMEGDSLGSYIGRIKNVRIEDFIENNITKKTLIGDLYISNIANMIEISGAPARDYIIEMAKNESDMLGFSIYALVNYHVIESDGKEVYELKLENSQDAVFGFDLVDEPCATTTMFKSFIKNFKLNNNNNKKNKKNMNLFSIKKKKDFTLTTDKGLLKIVTDAEVLEVGAEVQNEDGTPMENGTFIIVADNREVTVEDGKVTDIKEVEESAENEAEPIAEGKSQDLITKEAIEKMINDAIFNVTTIANKNFNEVVNTIKKDFNTKLNDVKKMVKSEDVNIFKVNSDSNINNTLQKNTQKVSIIDDLKKRIQTKK